ncbi:MAG: hypothetical protein RLZZ453_70 [Chlamydiota bacterium]|jgi:phosphatidylserine/phosphatidylglycerophosphate/cardiolipin synthase-like enzyme
MFIRFVTFFFLIAGSLCAQVSNHRVLFSPEDHLAEELISLIEKERSSIRLAAYYLSHKQVIKALIYAHERGVNVQVVLDPKSLRSEAIIDQMKKLPFPVLVFDPPITYRVLKNGKKVRQRKPLMHDKFCVFGEDRVWTGSFNFTLDASRVNKENALIVESREIASSYLAEFEKIKNLSSRDLSKHSP